jgi:hypothetical protein
MHCVLLSDNRQCKLVRTLIAAHLRSVSERASLSRIVKWRLVRLWVKLGLNLDVRAESAFPTITDIVDYGRDLRHIR